MDSNILDDLIMKVEGNPWTVRNAVEGVQAFGGIGSGKSSGSGRTLALKYLEHGFGGLVMTVKPSEILEWMSYCTEAGRSNDLCVIEPYGDYTFNFLDYEANREGLGGGQTENIVAVLKTVIKAANLNQGQSNNDRFWDDSMDMNMINILDLCLMGKSELNIDDIYAIARSLPKSIEQIHDDLFKTKAFYRYYSAIKKHTLDDRSHVNISQLRAFENLDYYFWETYVDLSEKTRSIVDHMLWGLLFRLTREPVYSLFCSKSPNIKPEDSIHGKIIVLNLPTKLYDKVGRDAQILFKYIWQRAMERRNVKEDGGRPVFLWADEAQNFIHEHDFAYQATARSSRVCTVYLTQNINNYYAALGGKQGEYQVKSFLGTLATKIFHSNADIETNQYASNLFGEVFKPFPVMSKSMGKDFSTSKSYSWQKDKDVPPELFTGLRTGGAMNNHIVEAYIHRQGMPWITKNETQNYIKTHFFQKNK
ncbi:MAG: TraM recognition domain-containing protein [Reichenbachiella sp.]|uniref:type IV secretory system conjugative DNA transfer family protein n=1 Tax=Reichenbachiella sp. TaxID=2184521 RepID=UPI003266FCC8